MKFSSARGEGKDNDRSQGQDGQAAEK